MNRAFRLAGALVLSLAALAVAAEDDDSLRPRENLSQWKWVMDIPLPKNGDNPRYDFLAPPAVLSHTWRSDADSGKNDKFGPMPVLAKEVKPSAVRTPADTFSSDLTDLRLIDGKGREVPYALRVRRAIDAREPLKVESFKAITDAQHQVIATLDLGDHARHNSIKIETTGQDFRRKAKIEARDEKTWEELLAPVELLKFQSGNQSVVRNTFDYPESRLRYVRVTVSPDPGKTDDRPELNEKELAVFQTVKVKPVEIAYPVEQGPREPVKTDLGYCSAWVLDFGSEVPIDRVTINAREGEFARVVQIEQVTRDNAYQPLMLQSGGPSVQWQRGARDSAEPLELRFSEVWARKLRIVVTDSRTQRLTLTDPQGFGAAREVIFPAGDPHHEIAHWEGPLKLYIGKPEAEVPNFSDFTAKLPVELKPPPVRIDLKDAAIEKNPSYEPPPLSFTERYPWLVYVVLGSACLALLAVLGLLARRALREAPQSGTPTPVATT
jgi:hypothetical protein